MLTPRQVRFLAFFTNPKSDTFGNAYRSSIKAGFSEAYSRHITSMDLSWLVENVRYVDMVKKAEKNLDDVLDLDTTDYKKRIVDRKVEYIKSHDPQLLKIKNDTSQFVAERLNKGIFSLRSEITGKDGAPLISEEGKKKAKEILNDFINRRNTGEGGQG